MTLNYIADNFSEEQEFEYGDDLYLVTITEYDYHVEPAQRGGRDSMGVPYEPDYPEEIELFDIKTNIQKFVGEIEVESLDEKSEEYRNVDTAFLKENYDKIVEYVKDYVIHN